MLTWTQVMHKMVLRAYPMFGKTWLTMSKMTA